MRERLLARHFLRRFLDNDILSPHADRHESLSVIAAALISSGLFVTVLLSIKYLFAPFQSPALTAVIALNDTFLYMAWSMTVMALVAVAEWDALSLDVRDTAILGPLPIPRGHIVRAKVAALAIFASGFAVALNFGPSVLHPVLLVGKLRVDAFTMALLIVTRVAATMAAGVFGFLLVLGLRETVRAALGHAGFSRVTTLLQGSLVAALVTVFLLSPGLSSGVARRWLSPKSTIASMPAAALLPPLWFVALNETLAGHRVAALPRPWLPPQILEAEEEAVANYHRQEPRFAALGVVALVSLAAVAVTALAAFLWNSHPQPPPVPRRTGRARGWLTISRAARRMFVREPQAEAGFIFTWQTISRSGPHRMVMAVAAAFGLAASSVMLRTVAFGEVQDVSSIPLVALSVQTVLVSALLVGFRHAVGIPADPRSAWTVHLSWSGDEWSFAEGVKRAALARLCLPAIAVLVPVHVLALRAPTALLHSLVGVLMAFVLIDALFAGFRRLPFASAYQPHGSVKSLAPIYLVGFLLLTYAVAWLERLALATPLGTVMFVAGWLCVDVALRAIDRARRPSDGAITLDHVSPEATQLHLNG